MTQPSPGVSAIVCAYTEKRWDDLVASVTALQRQTVNPDEIVLVIDHNPQLLERARIQFAGTTPEIIIVENRETKGLSGARNTGVAVSHGKLLIFIDDDAVAEPDCVAWLTAAFADPQVLGTGGKLDPSWSGSRPVWLPEEFYWVIGCSYRGMPTATARVRNPIGGCMCLRREVFEAVGTFQTGVGRIGTLPLGCEETELCIRANQHWPERVFLYEPRARVHHRVAAARTRWQYFVSRCYAEGISKALVSRLVGANDSLSSERSYTLRTLPQGILRGFQDAFLHADWAGLARAGAIIAGLGITTLGYAVGTLSSSRASGRTLPGLKNTN